MAIDEKGIWTRNITWFKNNVGRTDIQKNTLYDPRFKCAVFYLPNGEKISVSADDLRIALKDAPRRLEGKTIGPYNIDLHKETVFDVRVSILRDSARGHELGGKLKNIELELIDDGLFSPVDLNDARDIVFRSIVQRKGQSLFREKLIEAYGGKCAISGTDCIHTIEAAHIIPYLGEKTNHVQNGIILRSDLHTLFDLGLLTISESFKVSIDDSITSQSYRRFHGTQLRLPNNKSKSPSLDSIRERNNINDTRN